jgi:ABC-type transport system involved in multi-copper enzyme maturation permease subunit
MSIKEKGYTHWDGEFKTGRFPWLPITRYGIQLTFRKKFFKFLFFSSLIPGIITLVMIYVSERLDDFAFIARDADTISFLEVNPVFFMRYFNSTWLLFMIIMILVLCGAGLISDDLRFNSLQLYFSRPIKKRDYLLGKAAVIVFFLGIITLVPGMVFVMMKLLFAGNLKFLGEYPFIPFSILGFSLFVIVFFTFYTLLLSASNKNRRYVAVLIFGVYFFTNILSGILKEIFGDVHFYLLSLQTNLQQVGAVLFGQDPTYDIPWIYSLLVLLAFCALSAFILNKKVRGVEVVK